MSKNHANATSMTIYDVPINRIESKDQMIRDALDDDFITELAMSISQHGLYEPIVVRDMQDGSYQLCAGLHRLRAHIRLNKTSIPAHVIPIDGPPVKAVALVENIIRRPMTLDEEVKAIGTLHHDQHLSPSSICDLIGKSRAWVDRRLMIPQLPDDVKQELLDGRISISHAESIGRIQHDDIRRTVLNATIQQKLTVRQTTELTQIYMATPSMEDAVQAGMEAAREAQIAPPVTKKCYICNRQQDIINLMWEPICRDIRSCGEHALSQIEAQEAHSHAE